MPRPRTGTVIERGGKLYARISYVNELGQRRFVERRIGKRTEAPKVIRQLFNEMETGGKESLDAERMTFRQLAEHYRTHRLKDAVYVAVRKTGGLRTVETRRRVLDLLVEHFGHRRVRSITHADIDAFKEHRLATPFIVGKNTRGTEAKGNPKERPRSITTVNRELEILRAVLHYAQRQGWLLRNPFQMGDPLISKAAEQGRKRIPTAEEEALLIKACNAPKRGHLRAIIIGAIDTGLRRERLLSLRWHQVDLNPERPLIRLPENRSNKNHPEVVGLTSRFRQELARLWEASDRDAEGLVFGGVRDVKRAFAGACRDAGITDLHFHDLRHRFVTDAVLAGVPLKLAMKASGHSQETTFDRYLNVDEEIALQIARLMDGRRQV